MANNINVQVSMQSNVDNFSATVRTQVSQNTTSSNAYGGSTDVTSSAWTALSLGSLDDVRYFTAWNDNTVYSSSIIAVATGSGGGNLIGILKPGDGLAMPWSGSLVSLYAKVLSGDINGVVQYVVQQS